MDEVLLVEVSNEVCNKVFPNYLTVGLYNSHGRADSAAGVNVAMKVREGLAKAKGLRETNTSAYERGVQAVLSPYYPVEGQESLILMTSGRYEFVNKGFDFYIRALAKIE